MATTSPPNDTTPSPPIVSTPPSPSNDQSSPPPALLPPPQQGPPPNPPPALPPSTPPPAPPAPPPVPALPPPSFPPPAQPSPQNPPPAPQPPPTVPSPDPPSSSPPPPSTIPASSPPPPPAPSVPSPTLPTPASPATPTTPLPTWSPPPPGSAKPSPPPPSSISPPPSSTTGRPPPAKTSPPSSSSSSSTNSTTILIAVIGSLAAALVIFGLLFVCCWKKRRRNSGGESRGYPRAMNPGHATNTIYSHPPPMPYSNIPIDSSGSDSYPHAFPGVGLNMLKKNSFTLEELSQATDGFSEANLLGQGGFGYVHKGVLPKGEEVAIKQLKAGSGQGEPEFQAEVEIISRVHHKHLVSLVGYCISGPHRLLIYEFLPNDTLHFHLHGTGGEALDWPKRLRIALGSARGLAYLHEDCYPTIIHRDIKAANILLDYRFEAKVADFGLAKFCSDGNTHISTRVMGTFGYLAPEYASSGKLTEKSDVYSFGVVLLELITGRKPLNSTENMGESLVDWAKPYLAQAVEDEKFDALVDPRLKNDYDPHEMLRMVACAATSVRYSARYRPKMSQIVRVLEGNMSAGELIEGTRANARSLGSSQESLNTEYNTSQYNNDLSRFRQLAFQSQTYQSSGLPLPPSSTQ